MWRTCCLTEDSRECKMFAHEASAGSALVAELIEFDASREGSFNI
jgi:hypothetical protein